MRKQVLLAILAMTLIGSFGFAEAGANIKASKSYIKPGETVELIFTGTPGSNITVTVSDSRRILENASLVIDGTGQYSWSYMVNETAYTDTLRVTANIDGEETETGFIVSNMEPEQLVEIMRIMAANSMKQAESSLIQTRKAGKLDEASLAKYREAVGLLDDARSYAENGEQVKALEAIKTALSHFKSVIEEAYSDVPPEAPKENESATLRTQEVLRTLTNRLAELNRTMQKLEENGFNVDTLRNGINQMKTGLERAREQFELKNIRAASQSLAEVNENLERTQGRVIQKAVEYNQRKAASYQTSLINRYHTMRKTFTLLQSVNTERVSNVLKEMEDIENKLDIARSLYTGGDVTGSIRVLQMADKEFKNALTGLNGLETRRLLNSLDALTVRLENEPSTKNRERIQVQIETLKNSLTTKLENSTAETPRPGQWKTTTPSAQTVNP